MGVGSTVKRKEGRNGTSTPRRKPSILVGTWKVVWITTLREKHIPLTHPAWRVFIRKTSSSVWKMEDLRTARSAVSIRRTGRTTAVRLIDVCGRWIISVPGIALSSDFLLFRISLTLDRVGGVVSETSFKFFIQFVFYTTVFCIFNIIVLSIFVAELRREVRAVLM